MSIANFQRVKYEDMNACQKEIFNFQKVSSVLADFGFATYRLTDDWNGADFLAVHFDGIQFLRVQLKGRLAFEKKYQGKNLWVCFRHLGFVYLYPHDEVLLEVLKATQVGTTKSWLKPNGGYSFPVPPKSLEKVLEKYRLGQESIPT
jgi:hypothetical protein